MKYTPKMIYRNSRRTWRITWSIGTILFVISILTKLHLLYMHYYFFAVGMISFIYSINKCAETDSDGIKIFFGIFFNRKFIHFRWDEIEKADISFIQKKDIWQAGARIRIPIKEEKKVPIFEIMLKEPMDLKTVSFVKHHDRINFFIEEIQFDTTLTKLFIKNPPNKGFHHLLSGINTHLPTSKQTDTDPPMNYNKIIDLALVIIFIFHFTFYLFFRAFIFSL